MPTTIEKIVQGFPHPTVVPINGVPTFETLAALNLQLNANAASVQSNLGDGLLGLLFLTVSPEEYNALSNTAFIPPVNPGPTPAIPNAATDHQISAIVRQHTHDTNSFNEYLATDKALKQQVIGAIDTMYLHTLRHRITGFANLTTKTMLTHLYDQYGRLSPADLQENDTKMREQYDPNQPIESFIDQIEDSIALAAAANAPYSTAQILAIAYNTIFLTGMFPETCREWRRNPNQTWVNFKMAITIAHQDYRDSQMTTNQAGYHSSNAAFELQQDTSIALANLATATAADRSAVASLTTTISSITLELAEANNKLSAARTEITALKIELATNKNNGNNNNRPPRNYKPNQNYCWTHGYKVACKHTSATCTRPLEGHKREATRANIMGGTQIGKE